MLIKSLYFCSQYLELAFAASCVWNPRVFADDARGWQCPFVLCLQGGIGGRRRKGRQRMRWLDDITDSLDMSLIYTCVLC